MHYYLARALAKYRKRARFHNISHYMTVRHSINSPDWLSFSHLPFLSAPPMLASSVELTQLAPSHAHSISFSISLTWQQMSIPECLWACQAKQLYAKVSVRLVTKTKPFNWTIGHYAKIQYKVCVKCLVDPSDIWHSWIEELNIYAFQICDEIQLWQRESLHCSLLGASLLRLSFRIVLFCYFLLRSAAKEQFFRSYFRAEHVINNKTSYRVNPH